VSSSLNILTQLVPSFEIGLQPEILMSHLSYDVLHNHHRHHFETELFESYLSLEVFAKFDPNFASFHIAALSFYWTKSSALLPNPNLKNWLFIYVP
jgi:hypothetical protein